MYTSTMFGSPSKAKSHTLSRISDFETTSPARRMRNSSTANSRAVNTTSTSPRVQRWVTGLMVRSPAVVVDRA